MTAPDWTPADAPDLTGKVVIITGANNGLGFESAKIMAGKGAQIIMAVRTPAKGDSAAADIRREIPAADLHVMRLNLADLSSVRAFAQDFRERFKRLDILMNNAGVMATPQQKTADGFELQLGTNHLGHFALTGLLLDMLLATPESRVVNVSSLAAHTGEMHFDDLMLQENYTRFAAYRQSKLANLLFTLSLQKRLDAAQATTISVAAHPGVANTNLASSMVGNIPFVGTLIRLFSRFSIAKAEDGAESQLYAALMPDVKGGDYYGPEEDMRGKPIKLPMPETVKPDEAERLWTVSEELTGVQFTFSKQPEAATG